MQIPDAPLGRFRLFRRGFGLFALIPLLIGVVFAGITMFEGRKAERLENDGAVAVATITDKDIRVRTDSDGDRSTSYILYYAFTHQGIDVSASSSVSRGFFDGLEIGGTTEVRYWRPDPSVNEIEPGSTSTIIWITKLVSAVILAVAGSWIVIAWGAAGKAIRVRDRGERRQAVVTAHETTGVRVNNRPRYRLAWRDERGEPGRSFLLSGDAIETWPVGSDLAIYADPTGRLKPVWEGDVGPARESSTVRRG